MSINSALLTGVSGLVANSAALGGISDNIANSNTVGYKRIVTQFEDLVTAGSSSRSYNSGGVQANTQRFVGEQGQFTQTASSTDLAISGNGFFVVTDKATSLTPVDVRSYTRAGSFSPDSAGYLKNAAGLYLQGWPADNSGVVSPDPSDLTRLQTINVQALGNIPNPTASAAINANLNAAQTISAQEATYDATVPATSMAAYDPVAGTGVKPDFSTQVTVYDAKGSAHTFELDFLRSSAAPNTWHAEMRAIPAADLTGTTNGLITSGVLAFNPNGTIDATNTTFSTSAIDIAASSAGAGVRWAAGLGLPDQKIAFNLSTSPGGVTQYDSASLTNSTSVDGGPAGTLTGVKIDKAGYVTATFSNGAQRRIAQVALATFSNTDALTAVSGDAYRASVDSGTFTLKTAGEGNTGAIAASSLESSTVDLSSEFTGLIVTQRAYAASSKIISTADQMLQELINTKQ